MKIRTQMTLAQVPIAIIILLSTIFFVFALQVIEYKIEPIVDANFKNIFSMQRLSDVAEELENYAIQHPRSLNPDIKKLENKIEQELILYEKSNAQVAEEKELVQSLRKKWDAFKKSIHSNSSDVFLLTNEIKKSYKALNDMAISIIRLNQDILIRKKNNLSEFISDFRLFILFASFVSIGFCFFMSWIFTGLILSPLNKMTEIVSQFGKTDETILLHIKGSEEIEKLSNEFNLMTSRLEEYHQSSLGHVIENFEALKKAFDALPDYLLLFDKSNDIVFLNHAASKLFGILGPIKKKRPLLYLEDNIRASLLKIVEKTVSTQKTYFPETPEEMISFLSKRKQILLVPFSYPIKNIHNSHLNMGVLIRLQDLRSQSQSGKELKEECNTFIHNFQAPLREIHMAIHTILQKSTGPITAKQKELLYIARENCDEVDKLYQEFCRMPEFTHKM